MRPHTRNTTRALFICVFLILLGLFSIIPTEYVQPAHAQGSATIAEGRDFATRVQRDPWDMSELSDVSWALNDGHTWISNPVVANGIFTGTSTDGDPQFYSLFMGHRAFNTKTSSWVAAITASKIGPRYPIQSSTYHCIYYAMYNNAAGQDFSQVFWFADYRAFDLPGAKWGYSNFVQNTANIWKLYRIDLATSFGGGNTQWSNNATWQGLRIDPDTYGQSPVTFAFDWIRLTDCNAVNQNITWSPSGGVTSIWLTPQGTSRAILVKDSGIGSASAQLDVQGIAPGTYTVCLSSSATSCNSVRTPSPLTLTINQSPIVTITKPSYNSGEDYATQSGNAWDMSSSSDAPTIRCASANFSNGVLGLNTPPPSQQPGGCVGGASESDPKIDLNTPVTVAANQYRHLSFRMNTSGSGVPPGSYAGGKLVRWIWTIQGAGGPGTECYVVGWDIPFAADGYQKYWFDLADAFNGSDETTAGSCPGGSLHWSNVSPIKLRFDPNENILGVNIHQDIDWIMLTKRDTVTHGTAFPIQFLLNKSPQGITFNYYYTTDLNNPTQHSAAQFTGSAPSAIFKVYLPGLFSNYSGAAQQPSDVTFLWNTTNVTPGTYYICVNANDGTNSAIYCSDVPMQVT